MNSVWWPWELCWKWALNCPLDWMFSFVRRVLVHLLYWFIQFIVVDNPFRRVKCLGCDLSQIHLALLLPSASSCRSYRLGAHIGARFLTKSSASCLGEFTAQYWAKRHTDAYSGLTPWLRLLRALAFDSILLKDTSKIRAWDVVAVFVVFRNTFGKSSPDGYCSVY